MVKSYNILGFNVTTLPAYSIVKNALESESISVINTINPHSFVVQKNDINFRRALQESDLLIPDGSGIVLAARILFNVAINKIAGYDLFIETMMQLDAKRGKVFFLGSTENVLEKIKQRANDDFPNVEIQSYSPPFKNEFVDEDIVSFAEKINEYFPDVIFVGLTAPKQEKIIARIRSRVSPKMISGIGAAFDFYAGTIKYPSRFWANLHLEWLARFVREPRRLWRRNFISAPIFLKDVIVCKFTKVKNKR